MNTIPVEHLKIFTQRLNERYTIKEIIELLENLKLGKEQAWFEGLKTVFREVFEDYPTTLTYFIGSLNTGQLSALAFPRIFHLIKACMIFLAQTVGYLRVERLADLEYMDLDVIILYQRIMSTLIGACMKLLSTNKSSIFNKGHWSPVNITEAEAKKINQASVAKLIDFGVWNEFMDFLIIREEVMRPPQEICIMM